MKNKKAFVNHDHGITPNYSHFRRGGGLGQYTPGDDDIAEDITADQIIDVLSGYSDRGRRRGRFRG